MDSFFPWQHAGVLPRFIFYKLPLRSAKIAHFEAGIPTGAHGARDVQVGSETGSGGPMSGNPVPYPKISSVQTGPFVFYRILSAFEGISKGD
jgi:hypothetical protein